MSEPAQSALKRLTVNAAEAARAERLRRGWTMQDVASRAGVAIGTVHAVESGQTVSLETYVRVAVALGVSPSLTLDRHRVRPAVGRLAESEDFVHGAMGECEVRALQRPDRIVGIDEPYQHYQFAGRADVLVRADRSLLHIENRTRFPNLQEMAGAYNAKRQYLAAAIADRAGIGPRGWRSVTHVMACLWSSEVLHVLRLRKATFAALCPDGPQAFEAWLRGDEPPTGVTSTLVLLDPAIAFGSRRRTIAPMDDMRNLAPRHRDYAAAAEALRRSGVGGPG